MLMNKKQAKTKPSPVDLANADVSNDRVGRNDIDGPKYCSFREASKHDGMMMDIFGMFRFIRRRQCRRKY
jgi:hypothetical protein